MPRLQQGPKGMRELLATPREISTLPSYASHRLETAFMAVWCLVMPITSFLIVPSIQGTVPAYMMAFASVGLAFFRVDPYGVAQKRKYFLSLAQILLLWTLLFCGSQLGHLMSSRTGFGDLLMVDGGDSTKVAFRGTLFTQSLYLGACVCIALYFRYFFREEWLKYVLWGGWLAAAYGVFEWTYFLLFKESGDFLVNREFVTNAKVSSGSWSQGITIGPFDLLRIKSTFGEPAFFSTAVIPYLLLALKFKRRALALALLFCTLFSTSTSAYLGLVVGLLAMLFLRKRLNLPILIVTVAVIAAFYVLTTVFPETFRALFTDKFSGENRSGEERWANFYTMLEQLSGFSLTTWLFGIGFGYSYYPMFQSALINAGVLGLAVYLIVFFKPILLLRNDARNIESKVGLLVICFIYAINVAESVIPTTWMFLGIAYWLLDTQGHPEPRGLTGEDAMATPATVDQPQPSGLNSRRI